MPTANNTKGNSTTGPAPGTRATIDWDAANRDVTGSKPYNRLVTTAPITTTIDRKTGKQTVTEGPAVKGFPSYRKGGVVRKTGAAKLHKGERLLTKRRARKYRRNTGRSR